MPRPLILITPHTERQGTELPDPALSLSHRYAEAILAAGGLPLVMGCSLDQSVVRENVALANGILLSGGEDVAPDLYTADLPSDVRQTIVPAEGQRDLFEMLVIDETFRQARPLLAICRGQQILNVALGGDLLADISLQRPEAVSHNCQEQRFEPVHEVEVVPDSLLSRITGMAVLRANSTHHQAVGKVAPPLRVTGKSPDGIVEALELSPEHAGALPFLLAVQFHPERLYDRYPEHGRIFSRFIEHCRSYPADAPGRRR